MFAAIALASGANTFLVFSIDEKIKIQWADHIAHTKYTKETDQAPRCFAAPFRGPL